MEEKDSISYGKTNPHCDSVESYDAHIDDVDDLHPLVDQDMAAFLRDRSFEVDILDNNNTEANICKY